MKITIELTPEQALDILRRYSLSEKLAFMSGEPDIELKLLVEEIIKVFRSARYPVCSECGAKVELTDKGNCKVHLASGQRCYGSAKPPRFEVMLYEPNVSNEKG